MQEILKEIAIVFFVVTVHELSHVLAAARFGLKTKAIQITPLGQMAVIDGIHNCGLYERTIIFLAGPACNLVLAAFFAVFLRRYEYFIMANLVIALFNLLPVFPLDGGRIAHGFFSAKFGLLRANKFFMKLGRILFLCLFAIGLVQVILYPYNVSIVCVSVYLNKISRKEYIDNTFQFYMHIDDDDDRPREIKTVAVTKKTRLKYLLRRLDYEHVHEFHVLQNGRLEYIISQRTMLGYIRRHGMNGAVEELI